MPRPLSEPLFGVIGEARIAALIPSIPDPTDSPVKGAFMARLLPGVYLLALAAVFEDALDAFVDVNNIPWPEKTRPDLFNLIEVVSKAVPGIDADSLRRVRLMRDAVAHPDDTSNPVSWDDLDGAIDAVLDAFKAMHLLYAKPNISAFFNHEVKTHRDKVGPHGERLLHNFRVGAKLDDSVFIEHTHDVSYFPPDDQQDGSQRSRIDE